jgi:hypothetical protein
VRAGKELEISPQAQIPGLPVVLSKGKSVGARPVLSNALGRQFNRFDRRQCPAPE